MKSCPKCGSLFSSDDSECPACLARSAEKSKRVEPGTGERPESRLVIPRSEGSMWRWGCAGCLGLLAVPVIGILFITLSPRGFAYKQSRNSGIAYMTTTLGSMRSALSIYYGAEGGQYPRELEALTISKKYMAEIPMAWGGSETAYDVPHRATREVRSGSVPTDEGGWLYNDAPGDEKRGTVLINCTHTDIRGRVWAAY